MVRIRFIEQFREGNVIDLSKPIYFRINDNFYRLSVKDIGGEKVLALDKIRASQSSSEPHPDTIRI